jgi:hypothetical protein
VSTRIGILEGADEACGAEWRQNAGLLYAITVLDPGRVKSLTVINKLYNSVNNQFISNGIGIAKLEGGSALLD